MVILIKILQFFLSLSILIVAHEFGHFIVAKCFKIRVEKFYMFFDPWFSILKKKIGETEYGIGWLPLGGYVKISGMIDESMDKEQMKLPPQPWEFRTKPAWQRFLVMVAGVAVNFILALFIYSMVLFTWGTRYLPTDNLTYGVVCDSLSLSSGFRNGDKIVSLDGKKVEDFSKVVVSLVLDDVSTVTVDRDGSLMDVQFDKSLVPYLLQGKYDFFLPRFLFEIAQVPEDSDAARAGLKPGDRISRLAGQDVRFPDEVLEILKGYKGQTVPAVFIRDGEPFETELQISDEGTIGVYLSGFDTQLETKVMRYGFFESFPAGIKKGIATASSYLKQFKLFLHPETKAYESVGGFITIGNIFPGVWDWFSFWNVTAFLSIILAIMNILPIPALDGGHIVFVLYEMITRRKPSDKVLENAQVVGLAILILLLIWANGNDLIHLFK